MLDPSTNKANPNYSTFIQGLLEARKLATDPAELADLNCILERYQNDTSKQDAVDKAVASHSYKKISFARANTFNDQRAAGPLEALQRNAKATAIFYAMLTMLGGKYVINTSITSLAERIECHRDTVAKHVNWLLEYGYIAKVSKGSKSHTQLYMVNPCMVGTGKQDFEGLAIKEFKEYAEDGAWHRFSELQKKSTKQIVLVKGDDISYNELVDKPEEELQPVVEAKVVKKQKPVVQRCNTQQQDFADEQISFDHYGW